MFRLVRLHERLHGRDPAASVAEEYQAPAHPHFWRGNNTILTNSTLRSIERCIQVGPSATLCL